jgi:rubrerythrin
MKNNIQIRTLTKDDIERLAKDIKVHSWAVSFYLGIRGDRDYLSVMNSALSEGEKKLKAAGDFSEAEMRQIREALREIEDKIRHRRLTARTQTLAAFFADGGRRGIFKLPVYIPTRLVVEKDFYVHPFIKSLEKYPRYCVVFLERDRARIFDLFWGELEHKTEELRSEVPQRMNAARATWKGLEERKIQNHIEIHIDRHLDKVAGAVERYMEKNRIPYLVIGSRRELTLRFQELLSKEVQKKIVGSYLVRTDQSIKRIQEKSLEVIAEHENAKEEEFVRMMEEESSKKVKSAVHGAKNVLGALYDYDVRILLIGRDYAEAGYVCRKNHHPYLRRGNCPICGSPGEKASDIADEIIEEAVRQKARIVHFVFLHPGFDRFGVGAILR